MNATTDRLIMPPDVEVAPISAFDDTQLAGLEFSDGDWIVSRVGSRARSMVISVDTAELLRRFRAPCTIVDVIAQYARTRSLDPREVLEGAWPVLTRFLHTKWLVPEASYLGQELAPWYEPGHQLVGYTVEACIHLADDTQIYRARTSAGLPCALKVVDASSGSTVDTLRHEEGVLRYLDGEPSPRLIGAGGDGRCQFLAMEWCNGVELSQAVAQAGRNRLETRSLLVAILTAYASMHDRQVLHGDVHPGNVLIDAAGNVRIVDFGLARLLDQPTASVRRGGAPEYFDPEYAAAVVAGMAAPLATFASEQYALGALCYRAATGRDYLRFSLEAAQFYQQIADGPPLAFAENGSAPWPALEDILGRSLAKQPDARFASVAEMSAAVSLADPELPDALVSAPIARRLADRLIKRVNAMVDPDNRLFASGPQVGPRATFMNGAAGIAYYWLRVAQLDGGPAALAAADQWAERAVELGQGARGVYDDDAGVGQQVVGTVSPYHTRSGIDLVRGLVAHARAGTRTLIDAANTYLTHVDAPYAGSDPTLGSTGVLSGSSHLVRCLREAGGYAEARAAAIARLTDHANALSEVIVQRVVRRRGDAETSSVSHGGAAHGWAGILYALITWWEVAGRTPDDDTVGRLDELAGRGLIAGRGLRWPVRLGEERPSFMNSWCNGAPGYVYLWNTAHNQLGHARHGEMAQAAALGCFDDGGTNTTLCCGQAGHVFALLNMYRHSHENRWLRLASERLQSALDQNEAAPGGAWSHSLFRGDVGLALAAIEIESPDEARHPLFE